MPGNGVFLFARLCGNGVGMGTTRAVTGRGWGQNAAKGAGMGWGRGHRDKNIFCGAVMGSSTCPRVIL